mmetsp:Transcript_43533/g.88039  ORF Transcript_43533/g.88039 Transcript_43533/m.88039 type:complete len:86 (+) Transcript_43533:68-325(+)
MPRSCDESRHALWSCVLNSECANSVYDGHATKALPKEQLQTQLKGCMNEDNGGGSEDCTALRGVFFECQRQQLNMRTRIRGQKAY